MPEERRAGDGRVPVPDDALEVGDGKPRLARIELGAAAIDEAAGEIGGQRTRIRDRGIERRVAETGRRRVGHPVGRY